ncbi:MAG: aminoglycoside phosphotransferase family protein [Paracoccaceae bacterium]
MAAFLQGAGWADARCLPLAGDASNRRYLRVVSPSGASAVLMDAPPETAGDVIPFLRVAAHLAALGLSPPGILSQDAAQGFLLLEDLGDMLFSEMSDRFPEQQTLLYESAADVLTTLHSAPPLAGIPDYGAADMGGFAALAFDCYAPALTDAAPPDATDFRAEMGALWAACTDDPPVMILRDYHAENLLWLSQRKGVARVGLLDFQDAQTGPRSYDLISLVEDARRDVPSATRDATIRRYVDTNGMEMSGFLRQCAVISAQRHLRILGVFARLALAGKPQYIRHMPRTWGYLSRSLQQPGMSRLAALVRAALPEPTAAGIARLAARAGGGR